MNIVVIDGMGGRIGCAVVELLRKRFPNADIVAVGTNSAAVSAMLKSGAPAGASGENAVIFNCSRADYIVGVIGIVFANSMYGEVSPRMAQAVSESPAHKILIPFDKCNASIPGLPSLPLQSLLEEIPGIIAAAEDKKPRG